MGDLELSQAKEYLNSGQQNLDSGNYLIALFCFEQAIALNPDLAEAWEGKVAALRKLGRYEEAIAASEEAIALRMCVVGNNARFWFDQGIFQFESGNFEGAIASFEKTTRIQPDFHDAWHNHGLALAILENYGNYSARENRDSRITHKHETQLRQNILTLFLEGRNITPRATEELPALQRAETTRNLLLEFHHA
jgi:tetratricopeptide (TPR) repeat protein